MTDEALGSRRWTIPGGHVPLESTGPEPAMVSHERLCVLNTGAEMVTITVRLSYASGRDAGPYHLTVAPRRVRHVRINDLIDPYAPPLGAAYAIDLESTEPVVVQWSRQDTGRRTRALCSSLGMPLE